MQSANSSPSEKKRKRSVFTKSVSSGQLNTSVQQQNGHFERQNSCVSFIDLPYVIDSPDLIKPISLSSLPKFKSLYQRSNSVASCSPVPGLTRSNGSFSKMASRRNSSGNFRQLSESLVSQKQYTRPLSARTNSSGFFDTSADTLPGDTRLWFSAGGMAFNQTSNLKVKDGQTTSAENALLVRQMSQKCWVEKTFYKRECSKFIRSPRDPTKCYCGRGESWHTTLPPNITSASKEEKWHPYKHTEAKPTDAYGTIEFQGAPHPSKAQYVRLSSFDTKPEQVLQLLQKNWGLDLPKLLITVHGGILNFDIQPKLKRVFRKGLLKAAKTTGAWIVTGGTNTGVTRHVGDAISDRTTKAKNKVVAIGIAPWGVVENREDLIGRDIVVPYHCVSSGKSNSAVLNSNHSYFMLVDNGTVGKYGGDILYRKKLEKFICQQKICITSGFKGRGVPVICVVLEGGANTIRSVLEYVTDTPPVPVVVCDGSGRAADLLAFSHKYTSDDGTMPESLRDQLILTIQKTFQYTAEQAEKLFIELMLCVKKKELITVFRMGEGNQDIDLAILTALLKGLILGTNASAPDQLSLALTWDRVDIARSHIFVYGQEWPEGSLEQAMMDALINDRVDFVKLLLENGVSMHTFLTISRLEELYNTRQGPSNTLRFLFRDICKHQHSSYRVTLPDVGVVVQHLMGGAFRSSYCRKRFRQKYYALKQNGASLGNVVTSIPHLVNTKMAEDLFPYPFHDLMIWAVLMKRQKMALFMWQHGEEAMAKALLACRLYKAMAHEADQDDLEIELTAEFRRYAKDFQTLALELLEHCYKIDDDYTQQLLTYELKNFSEQTSLSLAMVANHREFIAHTCCQVLLNDLWIGGLRMRKNTTFKVIFGIFIPFTIGLLEFKSKEELQLMPQTMEEHLEDLADADSTLDHMYASFEEEQNEFGDDLETSFNQGQPGATNPTKENGTVVHDTSIISQLPFRKKKSPLRLGKKVYEFYNAPVTKFCAHTIAYLTFLVLFGYTVLAQIQTGIKWQEIYVMSHIFTLAIEKIRQIIASEPVKITMKIRVFWERIWNVWDTIAILLFTVGVVFRNFSSLLPAAHIIYTVDIVFWLVRILEILSVNKYLGPYVKIIGKLIVDMAYFLVILFIVVTSFGIVRQSVHFQHKPVDWHYALRNIWFYPYWMIYGELFADEIDPCDEAENCVYAAWVAPALMFLFLLVANILMVNLLIARFNATFIRNNAISREIWKFQRYTLIIEYEMRPILPPPLIIFNHIYLAFKYLGRRCKGKREYFDNGLKLFLSHEDTEKLHDFEEECVEDYFREKEMKFQSSSEERIRLISERSENMALKVDDMNQKENTIKLSLQTVDYRLTKLEEIALQTSETLNLLQRMMTRRNSTHSLGVPGGSFSHCSMEDIPISLSLSMDSNKNAGDASETLMRSQPSPILVHSKRPVQQDQLQKFTNYIRGRHLSGETYSQMPSEDAADTVVASFAADAAVEPPNISTESAVVICSEPGDNLNDNNSYSHANLLQRRHGPAQLSLNIKTKSPSIRKTSDVVSPVQLVSSSLETPKQGNLSDSSVPKVMFSTAKMPSETNTATQAMEKPDTLSIPETGEIRRKLSEHSIVAVTPVSPEVHPLTPNISVPITFISPDPSLIPQSAVKDLTSILTPLISEYTSITDEIDTSCIKDRSPQRSPTTSGIFFGENYPALKSKETPASKSEKVALKQAEEVGKRKMQKLIRHRLRQISQDETDSISDMAKLAVSELSNDEHHELHDEEEEEDENGEHDTDNDSTFFEPIEIKVHSASQDEPTHPSLS
ncbi:transient receptor potential cation channel subfamily M member 3 isoform X3 [Patella vulgata]|nr:transient receptor potential cation channel subfamily M member 3 isoform X3 [Patella vulgata]XP_050403201.2 transient receptor potential cation channel subfamily M member 3 isoform X3 [Patella vulgata]XP_050403202.2 transient receptor potential cation channel subfamily M member 3 isoform X3 [Patella vulgata]